jgi:quinone-modifying oxidoreductase subunit QmoA
MIVGGGIAGISAAVEAAEAGCGVLLVERAPYLGGRVAQMHQYFPKLCPPLCGLEINLRRFRDNNRLSVVTLAEVTEVFEHESHLRVKVRQQPRYVGDQCSACGKCIEVCPNQRNDLFNFGLGSTRAIYLPHAAAVPSRCVIDKKHCSGASCSKCKNVCERHAIELEMSPNEFDIDVQSLIWTTGWQPYDAHKLNELAYGSHPDIITNMMMERIASPLGPTLGKIRCPSDGREPKTIAFVQCAGSRDDAHQSYCSAVCCMATAKQVNYVRSVLPECKISVHYIDRRAQGNGERFLSKAESESNVRYVNGKVGRVSIDSGHPVVVYEDIGKTTLISETVDLVVLATGITPSSCSSFNADVARRTADGFLSDTQASPRQFVAGCAKRPMDVASSVRDATCTVACALARFKQGATMDSTRNIQ